jgi:hypothetical protein
VRVGYSGHQNVLILLLLSSDLVWRAGVRRREQALVGLLANNGRLPVLQKRPYSLVPVSTHCSVPASSVLHAGLSVYLVPLFYHRVVEGVESSPLDHTPYAHKGEDKRHEGEVRHLYGTCVRGLAAIVLVMPTLPVLPCRIAAGIGRPAARIIVPVIMARCGRRVVVARPAVAPGIVRFAFLDIRQDVVGCNQHSIALEAHMEGQLRYRGGDMTAVRVVQFDEGIETVLGVCVASPAPKYLIRSRRLVRLLGFRPPQQLDIIAVRGRIVVLRVVAALSCDLRVCECMTA